MRNRILITALLLLSIVVISNAQRMKYFRIKEKPILRFDWECTKPSLYPKAKLNKIIRPLLPKDWPSSSTWGDRAFSYDLNGDGTKEYFVPLYCGATGNCEWAIVGINPAKLLGTVNGESFYIHKRIGRWSRITLASHITVSESRLDTYQFRNGWYQKLGEGYETSAYRNDFPRSLLTVEPLCNPSYAPESIRPN